MRLLAIIVLATLAGCQGDGEAAAGPGGCEAVDPESVVLRAPATKPALKVVDQARSIVDLQDYDDKLLVSKLQSSANSVGGEKRILAYIDIGEADKDPFLMAGTDPDGGKGNDPVKL